MARHRRRSKEDAASLKGLGLAVIEIREDRRLGKTDLAKKAGVGLETLRDIEGGKREAKWGTLRRLALALEIPLAAMIEMALEKAPEVGRAPRRVQAEG